MPLPAQVVGEPLPYDTLAEIRRRMTEISPNLTRYGDVEEANYFAQAAELAKVSTNYSARIPGGRAAEGRDPQGRFGPYSWAVGWGDVRRRGKGYFWK